MQLKMMDKNQKQKQWLLRVTAIPAGCASHCPSSQEKTLP